MYSVSQPALLNKFQVFRREGLLGWKSAIIAKLSVEFRQFALQHVEFVITSADLPVLRDRVVLTTIHSVHFDVQNAFRLGGVLWRKWIEIQTDE